MITIFGPPNSGKTSLLATLFVATANEEIRLDRERCTAKPKSELAKQLDRRAREALFNGQEISGRATDTIGIYSLDLEIHSPRWWVPRALRDKTRKLENSFFWSRESAHCEMLDSPGGVLFQSGLSEDGEIDRKLFGDMRKEMLERLAQSTAAILCIDATNPDTAKTLFLDLPSIMGDIGLDRLPLRRLVICLTKIDLQTENGARINKLGATRWDPVEMARRMLPRAVLNTLQMYCHPDLEIGVVATSVYGFDQRTDKPLYNPEKGGFAGPDHLDLLDLAEAADRWQPLNVLEPFTYLITGRRRRVRLL